MVIQCTSYREGRVCIKIDNISEIIYVLVSVGHYDIHQVRKLYQYIQSGWISSIKNTVMGRAGKVTWHLCNQRIIMSEYVNIWTSLQCCKIMVSIVSSLYNIIVIMQYGIFYGINVPCKIVVMWVLVNASITAISKSAKREFLEEKRKIRNPV